MSNYSFKQYSACSRCLFPPGLILAPVCTSRVSSLHSSHKARHEFEKQNKTPDDFLKVFPDYLITLFVLVYFQDVEKFGSNHLCYYTSFKKVNSVFFPKIPVCSLTITTLSVHFFIQNIVSLLFLVL